MRRAKLEPASVRKTRAGAAAARKSKNERRPSLRGLAARLGVSHTAIEKGVRTGRLADSIGFENGVPFVKDAALAAREWGDGATKVNEHTGGAKTLSQAQLRVAVQRERSLELSNEMKRGKLIDAEAARRESFACARTVRDALANLAHRLAPILAAESDPAKCHAIIDDEHRLALESLAEVFAHGGR